MAVPALQPPGASSWRQVGGAGGLCEKYRRGCAVVLPHYAGCPCPRAARDWWHWLRKLTHLGGLLTQAVMVDIWFKAHQPVCMKQAEDHG